MSNKGHSLLVKSGRLRETPAPVRVMRDSVHAARVSHSNAGTPVSVSDAVSRKTRARLGATVVPLALSH